MRGGWSGAEYLKPLGERPTVIWRIKPRSPRRPSWGRCSCIRESYRVIERIECRGWRIQTKKTGSDGFEGEHSTPCRSRKRGTLMEPIVIAQTFFWTLFLLYVQRGRLFILSSWCAIYDTKFGRFGYLENNCFARNVKLNLAISLHRHFFYNACDNLSWIRFLYLSHMSGCFSNFLTRLFNRLRLPILLLASCGWHPFEGIPVSYDSSGRRFKCSSNPRRHSADLLWVNLSKPIHQVCTSSHSP